MYPYPISYASSVDFPPFFDFFLYPDPHKLIGSYSPFAGMAFCYAPIRQNISRLVSLWCFQGLFKTWDLNVLSTGFQIASYPLPMLDSRFLSKLKPYLPRFRGTQFQFVFSVVFVILLAVCVFCEAFLSRNWSGIFFLDGLTQWGVARFSCPLSPVVEQWPSIRAVMRFSPRLSGPT